MNQNEKTLIELLKSALFGEILSMEQIQSVEWRAIFEVASSHQLHTLLYPLVSSLPSAIAPEEKLMECWRCETLSSVKEQLQHVNQIAIVLNRFTLEQIPVVVLKGLVLRDYYPKPELRTMGDADLLVPKDKLNAAEKLLISMGYVKGDMNLKHIAFHHKLFPEIEVHWALIEDTTADCECSFTKRAWEAARPSMFLEVPTLILSDEDQLLHLLLHTSEHMKNHGFGLRQLCDIAIYTRAKQEMLHWELLLHQIQAHHLYRYCTAVYGICQQLFGTGIPLSLQDTELGASIYRNTLMEDILDAGVYGKKTKIRDVTCRLTKYIDETEGTSSYSRSRDLFHFLFPPLGKLGRKYTYAHKHPYLLPVAWLHRGIRSFSRFLLIVSNKEIFSRSHERAKLLHWLELR